jgi:hypothetical protein
MADVTVTCSGCRAKVVASEFADAVTCRSCGSVTPVKPQANASTAAVQGGAAPQKTPGLKLKDAPVHGEAIKPPKEIADVAQRVKARATARGGPGAQWANHPLVAWGVFIVLGGLSAWARFGHILPPQYEEMLITWGPAVALFFHAMVVVDAFGDSVLNGALSLLIPPYGFYYLFTTCDKFILRALYCGVLAGVGLDTFLVLKKFGIEAYIKVNSFIITGGG